MSFTITLQKNTSDERTIGKEITNIATMTGTLRDESSIIDPVILISANVSDLVGCNYMTISTFGRSYYIRDITSVRNNLVRITGHVDVLESFKAEILANNAIVSKQKIDWNLYLDDGTFRVYNNMRVQCKKFPDGFPDPQFYFAMASG